MSQQALVALIAGAALIIAFPLISTELDRTNFGYEDTEAFSHSFPNATNGWPASSSFNMVTQGTLEIEDQQQQGNWTSITISRNNSGLVVDTLQYRATNNPDGTITLLASDNDFSSVKDQETYILGNGLNVLNVEGDLDRGPHIRVRVELNPGTGGLESIDLEGSRIFVVEQLRPALVAMVKYVVLVVIFFLITLWMAGGRR